MRQLRDYVVKPSVTTVAHQRYMRTLFKKWVQAPVARCILTGVIAQHSIIAQFLFGGYIIKQ